MKKNSVIKSVILLFSFALIFSFVGCKKSLRFYYSKTTTRAQIEKVLGPADNVSGKQPITLTYDKTQNKERVMMNFTFSNEDGSSLEHFSLLAPDSHFNQWYDEFTSFFGYPAEKTNKKYHCDYEWYDGSSIDAYINLEYGLVWVEVYNH